MSELSGKSVVAIYNFAIDDDSAAYAGTKSNHDEVLHSSGSTVSHFTHSSSIGIIGKSDRNAPHLIGKQLGYRKSSLLAPFQIDSILDFTGIIVSVRNTHTDTANLTGNTRVSYNFVDSLGQIIDIWLDFVMCICSDYSLGQHLASHIYDA